MQPSLLRICDANCNRAREALRVLEDYARFTLNHAILSGQLKQLRHDFQSATTDLQSRAVAFRDASSDIGTGIKTETEAKRESTSSVVTAAGKRLTEALRSIEEYLKVEQSASSRIVEQIRYRAYDIEKTILLTLTPGRDHMRDVRLYVLITESLCKRPWLEVAEESLKGGADCLQLREKDLDGRELLQRAKALSGLCHHYGKLCIINDRVDIALLSESDGVHVGQSDMPAAEARKIMGPDKIVGVSTHHIEQAQNAVLDSADYIGVGPIYPSSTKPKEQLAGLEYARQIALSIAVPGVAISGINVENIPDLLKTGLRAVAVSSAVLCADDPQIATRQLKELLS